MRAVIRVGANFELILYGRSASENHSMVYNQPGYCQCGTEIWVEYLMSGNEWRFRFFGPENEEITQCPTCGLTLEEDKLDSM